MGRVEKVDAVAFGGLVVFTLCMDAWWAWVLAVPSLAWVMAPLSTKKKIAGAVAGLLGRGVQ